MKPFICSAMCVALLAGPVVAGETNTVPRPQTRHVSLSDGGVLRGVALNTAAKPMANSNVTVSFGSHIVARTKTRKDGSFAISGLRGGRHVVTIGNSSNTCVLWTKTTAPPNALDVVALNGDANTVRGQYVPPIGLETVVVAVGAGLIGGIIGYQVKDDDRSSAPSSP